MMHQKRGLRMWILSMLSAAPKNGVEIINEIEAMTRGWWRPSPGSVYPVLEKLTEEELIAKRPDGRYELTSKAEEQLDWPVGMGARHSRSAEGMVSEIAGFVSYLEELASEPGSGLSAQSDKLRELATRLAKLADRRRTP